MFEASRYQLLTPSRPHQPGVSTPWMILRASVARNLIAPSTANATPETSRSAGSMAGTTPSACSTVRPANTASPRARARPCSRLTCPNKRPAPCSNISPKAAASHRPDAWSTSTPIRSSAWRKRPDNTPATLRTSSWLFPPQTREVQFDEMWSFVGKKQKNGDPLNPDDDHKGDWWDHVAMIPNTNWCWRWSPGRGLPRASKKSSARSRTAIGTAFSQPVVVPQETAGPGRRPLLPQRCLDPGVTSATVRKKRQNNGVVAVDRTVVPGTQEAVDRVLKGSVCSRTINTSFVERQHATARGQNARPSRRTYRFSKDWEVHESMSYFTRYRYNFCWPVRTLRARGADGRWQQRAPAMSAGLSDHIWSMEEWLSFPVIQRI